MRPFVKWAGGKRQILSRILKYINASIATISPDYRYFEPFLGGGSVFFELKPAKATINDLNADLINAYRVIRSNDWQRLMEMLDEHRQHYGDAEEWKQHYYDVRGWDREPGWKNKHDKVEQAARMIFLNKICYNGLYRVNSSGCFNTPMGRYVNPVLYEKDNIKEIHDYLHRNRNITISNLSYEKIMRQAKADDIIYIDPPYDYQNDNGFTAYQTEGFSFEDFKALKSECDKALDRGAYIIISNNATDKVISLFRYDVRYNVFYIQERINSLRLISCNGDNRRSGREVIFWGIPNRLPPVKADNIERLIELLCLSEEELTTMIENSKQLNDLCEYRIFYNLSALSFLGYIQDERHFSKKAEKIRHSNTAMELRIAHDIVKHPEFKALYADMHDSQGNLKTELIFAYLKRKFPHLGSAALVQKHATIEHWLMWAHQILTKERPENKTKLPTLKHMS